MINIKEIVDLNAQYIGELQARTLWLLKLCDLSNAIYFVNKYWNYHGILLIIIIDFPILLLNDWIEFCFIRIFLSWVGIIEKGFFYGRYTYLLERCLSYNDNCILFANMEFYKTSHKSTSMIVFASAKFYITSLGRPVN